MKSFKTPIFFVVLSGIVSLGSICHGQTPKVQASADPTHVCVGGTLLLKATGSQDNNTYSWTSTTGFTSNEQNPAILAPPQGAGVPAAWDASDPFSNRGTDQTFTVTRTETATNGVFVTTDKVVVTVHPLPPCDITGPTNMCARNYGVTYFAPRVNQGETAWTYEWSVRGGGGIDGPNNRYWATVYALDPGNITVVVRVTRPGPSSCPQVCTLPVRVDSSPQLDGVPLANGVVGATYTQTVQVIENIFPPPIYTFTTITNEPDAVVSNTVDFGALPPGLTLDPFTGDITGTPTAEGAYTFPIGVANDKHCCFNILDPALLFFFGAEYQCDGTYTMYTLVVNCGNLPLSPPSLPRGDVGVFYTTNITVMGGPSPSTRFLRTEGSLPPGLSLANGGTLSGTPTAFGTFNFKVTAQDTNNACVGQQSYVLQVGCVTNMDIRLPAPYPPTSKYLPEGEIRKHYPDPLDLNSVLQLEVTNGTPPYTFAVTGGSLPAGINLTSTGAISGIPTSGNTLFVTTVTDANGCKTNRTFYMQLQLTCPEITLAPTSLIGGTVGLPYNQLITATNGTGASTFAITAGALPPGLESNPSGRLSGTPTTGGEYHFIVTSFDTEGCTASLPYTLQICGVITLTPANLTTGIVGVAYNQALTPAGDGGPFTFQPVTGLLPPGVSFNAGTLSGTPTAAGVFPFVVSVAATNGCTSSQNFTMTVVSRTDLGIAVVGSPNPVVTGENVTYTLTVTNSGPSTATGVVVTDVLPAGASFVAASSGCGASNNTVVCSLGTLVPGGSATLQIVATAIAAGTLTNTASVAGLETDPNLANNTTKTTTGVAIGALGFTAPAVLVSGNAGSAVLEVARSGDSSGAMSVNYATADETAVAGVDYTATAGTLAFAPGEMTRNITVPILQATGLGNKSVRVNLHTPTGGAALGAVRNARLTIVRGPKGKNVTLTDSDGDAVTVQLSGAGSVEISLAGGEVGPISKISLLDTDSRSVLNVKVKRGGQGDGRVTVGSVVGSGSLRTLNARTVNLVNGGINLGGTLGTVKLYEVTDALIVAGYTPTDPADPMAGGTFAPGGLIRMVTAVKFARSVVAAATVGSVKFGTANVDGGGKQCGVLASESISVVGLKSPVFKWDRNGANDQSTGDFHVRHLN